MLSKITLAGMHNFSKGSIWDNLSLPEGINKESFINECLRQGSEFCLLYPDLEFMKYQIEAFSKKWYHNFERWAAAYQFEYEALYNLDVKATIKEVGENKENASSTSNGLRNNSNVNNRSSSGNGSSSGNNTQDNKHYKAAYDASTPQITEADSNSDMTSLSSSEYNSESGSSSDHESTSNSESMTSASEHTITTEEYRRGNQGITMSQELLLAEYNAWLFNLYEHMAEIFVSEFCICIYT